MLKVVTERNKEATVLIIGQSEFGARALLERFLKVRRRLAAGKEKEVTLTMGAISAKRV